MAKKTLPFVGNGNYLAPGYKQETFGHREPVRVLRVVGAASRAYQRHLHNGRLQAAQAAQQKTSL